MGTNITNGTQWTFLDMNLTDLCNATNVSNAHCNATNATDMTFRDRCNPPGGSSGGVDVQALIGIFLAALSALISSVALVIMKRSADVEVGLPLCKRWRWWLGFVINTGSELTLSTVALTLAPTRNHRSSLWHAGHLQRDDRTRRLRPRRQRDDVIM